MRRDRDEPLLDAAIRVDHLSAEGRELKVTASPAQREAIAVRMGVSAVERLDAALRLTRFSGGIEVRGRLAASVVQPCVVSFEPVRQEIDEPVERVFLPGREAAFEGPAGAEIFVDLEGDPPDRFEGPELDLTELLLEVLALAIDPYPRAPGATVELPSDSAPEASPFAALGALKPRGE